MVGSSSSRVEMTSVKRGARVADSSLMVLAGGAGVFAFACMSIAATACGSKNSNQATASNDVKAKYDAAGRLTLLTSDRNGDGKVDTWGYMDGSRVVRIESDENGDGTIDRWEYHKDPKSSSDANGSTDRTASGGDVTLERIDRATKFDGRISRREYFENGALTRVEEDTDGDGKIDKWETYSAGTLTLMATDSKARGTPDRRLIYLPDGTLSRIETDPDGTGSWRPLPQ